MPKIYVYVHVHMYMYMYIASILLLLSKALYSFPVFLFHRAGTLYVQDSATLRTALSFLIFFSNIRGYKQRYHSTTPPVTYLTLLVLLMALSALSCQ